MLLEEISIVYTSPWAFEPTMFCLLCDTTDNCCRGFLGMRCTTEAGNLTSRPVGSTTRRSAPVCSPLHQHRLISVLPVAGIMEADDRQSDDSPSVIPPSALDKPRVMKVTIVGERRGEV